jgi:hypothetical protein
MKRIDKCDVGLRAQTESKEEREKISVFSINLSLVSVSGLAFMLSQSGEVDG